MLLQVAKNSPILQGPAEIPNDFATQL